MGAYVYNATSVCICMEEFIHKSILKKEIKKKIVNENDPTQSTCKMWYRIETKWNETKYTETKRNLLKQNKRNSKRNLTKRNENKVSECLSNQNI